MFDLFTFCTSFRTGKRFLYISYYVEEEKIFQKHIFGWYMDIKENILAAVGDTPLVRINRLNLNPRVVLAAKIEHMNPGGSIKDRVALNMVVRAEREGKLKPGGTIVEGTSGNTGVGLAMVAAIKGYRVIFTIPDKMSRAKVSALKAYGAQVVVTPTNVAPDDPRSYYSVAARIARETPGAVYLNQYENPANPQSHYETTGPEIWKQTEGKVDVVVIGAGTGGTISGVGKFLKEKNAAIRVVAADTVGSIYTDYFKTGTIVEPHPYRIEGIGEDILPATMDFSVVDEFIQVGDDEGFDMTRRLAREEGILVGTSSGATLVAALEVAQRMEKGLVVTIFPDSGVKYLEKVFSD